MKTEYTVHEMTQLRNPLYSLENNLLDWLRGDIGKGIPAADLNQAIQIFQGIQHGVILETEDGEPEIIKYK